MPWWVALVCLSTIVVAQPCGGAGFALAFGSDTDNIVELGWVPMAPHGLTISYWARDMWATPNGNVVSIASYELDNEFSGGTNPINIIVKGEVPTEAPLPVDDDEWHHYVFTWDSGNLTMWLDGEAVMVSNKRKHALSEHGFVVLGQEQDAVGGLYDRTQAFHGLLDEYRMYNVSLSAEEATSLFTSGTAGSAEASLYLYLPFDEGTGRQSFASSGTYVANLMGASLEWVPSHVPVPLQSSFVVLCRNGTAFDLASFRPDMRHVVLRARATHGAVHFLNGTQVPVDAVLQSTSVIYRTSLSSVEWVALGDDHVHISYSTTTSTCASVAVVLRQDVAPSGRDLEVVTQEDEPLVLGFNVKSTVGNTQALRVTLAAGTLYRTARAPIVVMAGATYEGKEGDLIELEGHHAVFLADPDEHGSPYAVLQYYIVSCTGLLSPNYTVSIHVLPINDYPVLHLELVRMLEDTPKVIEFNIEDVDGSRSMVIVYTMPRHGQLFAVGADNITSEEISHEYRPWLATQSIRQWASTVVNVSSQYQSGTASWSAEQILGPPGGVVFGFPATCYSTAVATTQHEFITVGFKEAVYIQRLLVHQCYATGSVFRVWVQHPSGEFMVAWEGPPERDLPEEYYVWEPHLCLEHFPARVFTLEFTNVGASRPWGGFEAVELVGERVKRMGLFTSHVRYVPQADFSGEDSMEIKITDCMTISCASDRSSQPYSVPIIVDAVNDPPHAPAVEAATMKGPRHVTAHIDEDTMLTFSSNDKDSAKVFMEITAAPTLGQLHYHGALVSTGDTFDLTVSGEFVYAPPNISECVNPEAVATDHLEVLARDGEGGTSPRVPVVLSIVCFHLVDCPPGQYPSTSSACVLCNPGSFKNSSDSALCLPCPVGTVAPDPGALSCTPCPAGSASAEIGAIECSLCGVATYNDVLRQRNCIPCPPNTHANYMGARALTECVCKATYHSDGLGRPCHACPSGAVCHGSIHQPTPAPGYWLEAPGSLFLQCLHADACPGGASATCGPGFSGPLCAHCSTGFYRLESRCVQCEATAAMPLIFITSAVLGGVVLVTMLFSLYSQYLVGDVLDWCVEASVILATLVDFTQMASVLRTLRGWPKEFQSLLVTASVSVFNFEVLRLECLFGQFGFSTIFLTRMLLPFAVAIPMLLVFLALQQRPVMQSYLGHVLLFLARFFYITLATSIADLFLCYQQPSKPGMWSLIRDPSIQCFTGGPWLDLVPAAIIATGVYMIGIPAVIFHILRRMMNDSHPSNPSFRLLYHNQIWSYAEESYFWHLVLMARKFLFALVVPVIVFQLQDYVENNGIIVDAMPATCFSAVLLFFLLLHVRVYPYAFASVNLLETRLLSALIGVLAFYPWQVLPFDLAVAGLCLCDVVYHFVFLFRRLPTIIRNYDHEAKDGEVSDESSDTVSYGSTRRVSIAALPSEIFESRRVSEGSPALLPSFHSARRVLDRLPPLNLETVRPITHSGTGSSRSTEEQQYNSNSSVEKRYNSKEKQNNSKVKQNNSNSSKEKQYNSEEKQNNSKEKQNNSEEKQYKGKQLLKAAKHFFDDTAQHSKPSQRKKMLSQSCETVDVQTG